MEAASKEAPRPTGTPAEKTPYRLTRWKKVSIALAVLCLVGGAVLAFVEPPTENRGGAGALSPAAGPTAGDLPVKALGGGGSPARGGPGGLELEVRKVDAGERAWSPALLRGGISFFVAFVLAYAFRAFLRLAAIFLGVWAASLFFLDHLGWIEVHWTVIDTQLRSAVSHLGDQFQSVKTFITGSLPSATLAGLGLLAGFKKK